MWLIGSTHVHFQLNICYGKKDRLILKSGTLFVQGMKNTTKSEEFWQDSDSHLHGYFLLYRLQTPLTDR